MPHESLTPPTLFNLGITVTSNEEIHVLKQYKGQYTMQYLINEIIVMH